MGQSSRCKVDSNILFIYLLKKERKKRKLLSVSEMLSDVLQRTQLESASSEMGNMGVGKVDFSSLRKELRFAVSQRFRE